MRLLALCEAAFSRDWVREVFDLVLLRVHGPGSPRLLRRVRSGFRFRTLFTSLLG